MHVAVLCCAGNERLTPHTDTHALGEDFVACRMLFGGPGDVVAGDELVCFFGGG
jgi:hypothetical protein